MTDKPRKTDDAKDEDVLEPDEVIFDAAETAFMADEAERAEKQKKG